MLQNYAEFIRHSKTVKYYQAFLGGKVLSDLLRQKGLIRSARYHKTVWQYKLHYKLVVVHMILSGNIIPNIAFNIFVTRAASGCRDHCLLKFLQYNLVIERAVTDIAE